jgi:DNA-binding CsgD family transcriptional regulator
VRDAVYHELPPAERELEHERAAQVLRDAGADDEHVAAQLLLAPRRGAPWVSELLGRAGEASFRKGAAESAVAYLRRALEEPPPSEHRTEILIALGTAEAMTNGPAAAEHLQQAQDALDDPLARGQIAILLFRALLFTGRSAEAAAVAERAGAALGEQHGDLRRTLEALALATYFFGSEERLLPLMTAHREPPREPGPGAKALAAVAAYDWANRDATAEQCAELALSALEGGELHATGNGLIVVIATVALVLAEHPQGLESLELVEAGAHRRGSLLDIFSVQLWKGYTLRLHGQLDEAVAQLDSALTGAAGYELGARPRAYADGILCHILVDRGELAQARRALELNVDMGDASDAARHWLHAELALLVAEGRWEDAVAAAERFERRFQAYRDSTGSPWRLYRAEALDRLGRTEEALALAREELDVARRFGAPGPVGRALRVLGRLERAAGVERLEEAVAVLRGSLARLEHARALAALGAALRHVRRPADAREPLREALELAAACGAPALAEGVRSELYAAGARPRTDALGGIGSLTASERRVADLAAGGETNRDIAQALYVTPKTVEVHLSNAYRKLGIRSRRELAGALTPTPPRRNIGVQD